MALSDPILVVNCDDCGDSEDLSLTCTAQGWDDRSVSSQLKRLGWTWGNEHTHYCKDCSRRRAAEEKR